MSRLPPLPDIVWDDAGALVSRTHADIYFSREGGLAETQAVFLAGCGLPQAWAGRTQFTIAELGFGTGLNVLAAWDLWARTRAPGAVLHIQSIELAPLQREDAARALAAFPEIGAHAERLLAAWPARCAAEQRIWAPQDGFCLTVHVGEAAERLAQLPGPVDAWFLDGFAPARNPQMWGEGLFRLIAAKSAPGARLATYSVAGDVRRGLEAAGFIVRRAPGHGRKRERLEAAMPGVRTATRAPDRIGIIGGGIAGAAAAAALAKRGRTPIVIERAPALAHGASGNPAGLVSPRLDRGETPAARFLRAAYLAAVRDYEPLGPEIFNPCGVEHAALHPDLAGDPPLPGDHMAGAVALQAGVLRPAAAIAALTAHAEVRTGTDISALAQTATGWSLLDAAGREMLAVDALILAGGAHLPALAETAHLPIQLSRGQMEWGRPIGAPPARARTGGSYVAPFGSDVAFGATFTPWPDAAVGPKPDAASRVENLAALKALAPLAAAALAQSALSSRAALRAALPDRLPLAGFAPDAAAVRHAFAGLAFGRPPPPIDPPRLPGLYLLGGFGARGLTYAPLLGEAAASAVLGEPAPFGADIGQILDPARFLLRSLKRR